MPIRITCPSCSATLSVKDEFAGRAVKCPKCGGVIPPQPAAPTASEPNAVATLPPPPPPPPAPPPEPEKLPLDEPEKPAKTGGKITGKPFARSKDADEDDEDDRPRRKRRDDEDDRDDKPRSRNKRDEGDRDRDDEDRPAKRRRRDEDDDDDDRPNRGRKQKGKSNAPLILGIVGFFLLTCCGGVGYGVYWAYNKAKETVEKVKEELERTNISVNKVNFDNQLKVGSTTRQQAESIFGKGRAPTADDLAKAFGNDKSTIASWQAAADKNRALLWQNGDDYILVQFHPNMENTARVQMKQWKPKNPPGTSDGSSDDAAFARQYPDPKKGEDLSGPTVDATSEEISTAYKNDKAAADAKYKDKVVTVEGVLETIDLLPDGGIYARLIGTAPTGTPGNVQPRCVVTLTAEQKRVFECSRGQTIKFKGRCAGMTGPFVDVMSAKVESVGPDPSVNATVATYLADYARNEMTADEKYKEKQVTLTNAIVESKTGNAVYLIASTKAKTTLKIKVSIAGDIRRQFENLKVGDRIPKVKGEGRGKLGDELYLNGVWIVH